MIVTRTAVGPVFSDDSGRRAKRLRWTTNALLAAVMALAASLAVALTTHIPIPPLPQPIRLLTGADHGANGAGRPIPVPADLRSGPVLAASDRSGPVQAVSGRSESVRPRPPLHRPAARFSRSAGVMSGVTTTKRKADVTTASVRHSTRPRPTSVTVRRPSVTAPASTNDQAGAAPSGALTPAQAHRPTIPPGQVKKQQRSAPPRGKGTTTLVKPKVRKAAEGRALGRDKTAKTR